MQTHLSVQHYIAQPTNNKQRKAMTKKGKCPMRRGGDTGIEKQCGLVLQLQLEATFGQTVNVATVAVENFAVLQI